MSKSYNRVILIGNLTRDPDLKVFPDGGKSVFFTVATNKEWNDENGEHKKSTFVECRMRGAIAQTVSDYFYKGRPIFVEGELTTDQWTDQSGNKREKLRVIVHEFRFIDSKKTSEEDAVEDSVEVGANDDSNGSVEERLFPDLD